MGGINRQKKSSGFFNIFKPTGPRRSNDVNGTDDSPKAYKVYRSDEDRDGRVAERGIDKKVTDYITTTKDKWNRAAASN